MLFDAVPSAATAPIAAGVTSFAATLSLAAGASTMIPPELPSWMPYLMTIVGPLVILLGTRVLAAFAASRRSLAASQEVRAHRLLSDKDPRNDAEGRALEDKAAQNRSIADALEALKQRKD